MMLIPKNHSSLDFFNNMLDDPFFSSGTGRSIMKTDIQEKDGNYVMDVDLPGVQKENINVEFENGYLTISAESGGSREEKDEKGNYLYQERHSGHSSRTFYLGEGIDKDDIKASYKDGLLKLTFPKKDAKELEAKKSIPVE